MGNNNPLFNNNNIVKENNNDKKSEFVYKGFGAKHEQKQNDGTDNNKKAMNDFYRATIPDQQSSYNKFINQYKRNDNNDIDQIPQQNSNQVAALKVIQKQN